MFEEEYHQCALIEWAQKYDTIGPFIWHTPNGGKRNPREAQKLKRMGTKAGVWDLFLAIPMAPYHGLFIEMKSTEGKLSPSQTLFGKMVSSKNYQTFVARDWEDAKNYILKYLEKNKNADVSTQ